MEEVKDEEAQQYAKSINAEWGLTSAKTERESFVTYLQNLIKIYIIIFLFYWRINFIIKKKIVVFY